MRADNSLAGALDSGASAGPMTSTSGVSAGTGATHWEKPGQQAQAGQPGGHSVSVPPLGARGASCATRIPADTERPFAISSQGQTRPQASSPTLPIGARVELLACPPMRPIVSTKGSTARLIGSSFAESGMEMNGAAAARSSAPDQYGPAAGALQRNSLLAAAG